MPSERITDPPLQNISIALPSPPRREEVGRFFGKSGGIELTVVNHPESIPREMAEPTVDLVGFLTAPFVRRVDHDRQDSSLTEEGDRAIESRQSRVGTGNDRVITRREVTEIEHHRIDRTVHPLVHALVTGVVELDLRQMRRFGPGLFDRVALKVEPVHPAFRANEAGEKQRVVPIAHRRIDGAPTGGKTALDEEMGDLSDAGQGHRGKSMEVMAQVCLRGQGSALEKVGGEPGGVPGAVQNPF